ncbi:MAG TPA: transglycosylase SLT domain-containing protein [Gemmatimonadaceae bacterium]|nr:transglycosylase SLT domain-containing protein [Gemmatimonadaceae bacterium]
MSENYERRSIEPTSHPRSARGRSARTIAQAVFAGAMMVGGVVWAGTRSGTVYAKPGELLSLPATVVTPRLTPEQLLIGDATPDLSAPVTQRIAFVLRKFAKDDRVADRAATALVREAAKKNIDPVLLVGLMITENSGIDPMAKSNVGATGLMQVMPFHAGEWGCGSDNLVNVESNICHGVAILADYVRRSPTNLHKALLGYNGCVRGTNTPRCHTYSSKVYKHANNASRLMASIGGTEMRVYSAPVTVRKARTAKRATAKRATTNRTAANRATLNRATLNRAAKRAAATRAANRRAVKTRATRARATKPAPIKVPRQVVLGEIKVVR